MYKIYTKNLCWPDRLLSKILFIMKLTTVLLIVTIMQVSATTFAQRVTINQKDVLLEQVFKQIRIQSGYNILYDVDLLKKANRISIKIKDASIDEAMRLALENQQLIYTIKDKTIILDRKQPSFLDKVLDVINAVHVRGRVVDEQGNALAGATVTIKGMARSVITNANGDFILNSVPEKAILVISYIGYEPVERSAAENLTVVLIKSTSKLDEIQVIAYGTTTQRINTGSVGKVTAKEIESQPVMNPLAALAGRIAGLTIVQSSGIPGGSFSVNIRGRTSVNAKINNDPLFIIDGVPFANNNNGISTVGSALNSPNSTGLSPFNSLSPSDIESVEVLKDADATSIYGSRGANGVVLITTKKGKPGKTTMNANVYTGFSSVTRTMDMMNTQQYLNMRHEAFANDGIAPDEFNAYDLQLWDTTRYTDWKKDLIQHSANTLDANVSFSGGDSQTQFLVGGGYHRETMVFPGDLNDGRSSLHFHINHQSTDHKFKLSFSGSYGGDRNRLNVSDLTGSTILLTPNSPPLTNAEGSLNWDENGAGFENPLSYLYQKYMAKTDNYLANLSLNYQLVKGLSLKGSFGYNGIYIDELGSYPIAAQNPMYDPVGYATFGKSNFKSLIVEPQIEYERQFGPGKVDALIGGTWSENSNDGMSVYASGYTSDVLLESLSAAGSVDDKYSINTAYKYAAVFGRINYNIKEKYILNLTGRRDGSSRFGPGKRYANFGAVGAAWIFSSEDFIKQLPLLSFGKLRGSYGTSGNDKIGDYMYLDTWTALSKTYLGNSGLNPTRLFNPDYRWEMNKKLEFGLDLGFVKDRILLTANWYRNRSSNQLIPYTLPSQTGGGSITANFPATVQNAGTEFTLNTSNVKHKNFEWSTSFNISSPRNKLVSFPNLESSTYNSTLIIGRPLGIIGGLVVKGVNPETGVYEFVAQDGHITSTPVAADARKEIYDPNPKFLGGFGNNFRYKGFQADFFLDFKKQTGINYLGNLIGNWDYPGMAFNMPLDVLDRWTPNHTITDVQKYTANPGTPAYVAANAMRLYRADLFYSDASYIRLRNVALSYTLPESWTKKAALKTCRFYINIQNLITFTGYKGSDPETQNIFRLPPLKTISAGLQVTL